MTRLLIVDDSALARKLLSRAFAEEKDFEVELARDGFAALEQLARFKPDVVTLDINMPKMDGLACLDRIMIERPCPVVMVSSQAAESAQATLEALRLGAVDFVAKPDGAISLHIDEWLPTLVATVRAAALAKPRLSLRLRERVRHHTRRPTTIGTSPDGELEIKVVPKRATGEGLVVVGTSTGGPPALEALLRPLTPDFPWPIIVAQHMPAGFTSALAKRLDALSPLSVCEVWQPVPLRPGNVYIGRGNADIVVTVRARQASAMAVPSKVGYPWHPSVDRLVRSAMEHFAASQIIGVLMTGMGSDGAEAMASLRRDGGRTIAEAEETAVVWGMPGSLVQLGGADWVLPLSELAAGLQRMVP